MTAAGERAGLRLGLLAGAVTVLVVVLLPLAVLVRDRWSPLAGLDARVEASAHRLVTSYRGVDLAAQVLTFLGSPPVLEVATVVLVGLLAVRRLRRPALFLAVCVAGAYLLSTVGKYAVARARPVFPDPVSHAFGPSFPSGHTTGAAAFYAAVAVVVLPRLPRPRRLARWAVLAVAVLVPLVVAVTRVLLGVHFLTDVVAGLLLGWGWVAGSTAVFVAWRVEQGRGGDVALAGVEPP